MKRRVTLKKEVGETPLMAIHRWKAANPSYQNIPACYAGRLDPMASGKLLVLLGDECKKQKEYTSLDKQYDVEVLFDVGSDTGDALGLVAGSGIESVILPKHLKPVLDAERGIHRRAYPIFSSKTVHGKPLFLHALEGSISEIQIPEHDEHIYSISIGSIAQLDAATLQARITAFLTKVPKSDQPSKKLGADFRIHAVEESWRAFFAESANRSFLVVSLRVNCGSGTYMRSLVERIGEACGTRALALSINRTKIGKYWKKFWLSAY